MIMKHSLYILNKVTVFIFLFYVFKITGKRKVCSHCIASVQQRPRVATACSGF